MQALMRLYLEILKIIRYIKYLELLEVGFQLFFFLGDTPYKFMINEEFQVSLIFFHRLILAEVFLESFAFGFTYEVIALVGDSFVLICERFH